MDIYSVLAHPLRQKLLEILDNDGYVSYTELMEKLGLETTGQLNFHLKKLSTLIGKDKKSYYLTEDGKRVIKLLEINRRVLAGDDIETFDTRKSEINRVGVIICNCMTEISNVIDITQLENYVKKIPSVVSVKIFENLCQVKNLKKIEDWCKDSFLNKIVIAACSPKSHRHVFERIFEGVIDIPNIEIANIREQCGWVHESDPRNALKKAQLLIEAAVERVKMQKNVQIKRVEIEKSCAILGGGIAGMTIALNLARAGVKVYLIEKSPTLGGKVARWSRIFGMGDCSICFLSELISELVKEENIEILTNTEIEKVSGEVGNFVLDLIRKPRYVDELKCTGCKQCTYLCTVEKSNQYEFDLTNRKLIYIPFTQAYPYAAVIDQEDIETCRECRICERACTNKAINLDQKPEKVRIKVGAKVLAIGMNLDSNLAKCHYDRQKDIITSAEFERIISADGPTEGYIVKLSDGEPPRAISIVQCVGGRQYESEFGDYVAIKYLDSINQKLPFCKVDIFFPISEEKGHDRFLLNPMDNRIHYVKDFEITEVDGQKMIIADAKKYPTDLIILNINAVPNKDLKELRKVLDFTLNDNGFMGEETLASGVYGVGSVMGPYNYNMTIKSANQVALNVLSLLSQDHLIAEASGIEINGEKCGLCGLCAMACPYNAIVIEPDKNKITVDSFKCKGCGTCVSICPTKAVEMNIESTEKILKTIEVLSKYRGSPKIIAFCCRSCGYGAADEAGLKKIGYNPNVFVVEVPCTGRVDSSFILKAFEVGFDGVMVVGCNKDSCRFIDGAEKVRKKIRLIREVLGPATKNRIMHKSLSAVEGSKFAEIVNNFYDDLVEEVQSET